MSKVRVPKWGNATNYVVIEADATVGATIGVNLFNKDGSLFDLAAFSVQVTEGNTAGNGLPPEGQSVVTWASIQSLPANVGQAADLAGEGFLRRNSAGGWTASPIVNADLSGADTDGISEGSANLYFTDDRVDARYDAVHAALVNAVDDTAAAGLGVAIGKLYRNGSVLQIRVT